jgi:hypothetical protein
MFLIANISDRFLEQRITIKFCVKLGKNASDTCAMIFEDCGGEAIYSSQVLLSDVNGSKCFVRTWNVVRGVVIQNFTQPMKTSKT